MRCVVVNVGSRSIKLRAVQGGEAYLSADLTSDTDRFHAELAEFVDAAGPVDAVGHRVVHGGPSFDAPVVVDDEVWRSLEDTAALAPLHNPPALAAIKAARRIRPYVPSVACFDTSFHAGLPEEVVTYALPEEWRTQWGIRRYGFHGISCAWALRRSSILLGQAPAEMRLAVCHLGGGASVTGIQSGRSADTSMGFTPLEGLVMATRSGDVDPGALLWVLGRGLSVADAQDALEHGSGLLGLSGRSADMQQLLAARRAGDAKATLAVSVYLHRLRAKIAAMAAATGGLDAVVFTGGVGENSDVIRAEACAGLEWMGVGVDRAANSGVPAGADAEVSARDAPVRVLVVRAREELQIAAECERLLNG